jgi:hypothetical protein
VIFKVTHINPEGQRRKAMVTAVSVADAQDQVFAAWGFARALACLRCVCR